MSGDKSQTLKRFQDALRGRVLSGTAAYEINEALCEGRPYKQLCDMGEKLPGRLKIELQVVVDRMLAEGIKPAMSLLTPHQKRAIERRKA